MCAQGLIVQDFREACVTGWGRTQFQEAKGRKLVKVRWAPRLAQLLQSPSQSSWEAPSCAHRIPSGFSCG